MLSQRSARRRSKKRGLSSVSEVLHDRIEKEIAEEELSDFEEVFSVAPSPRLRRKSASRHDDSSPFIAPAKLIVYGGHYQLEGLVTVRTQQGSSRGMGGCLTAASATVRRCLPPFIAADHAVTDSHRRPGWEQRGMPAAASLLPGCLHGCGGCRRRRAVHCLFPPTPSRFLPFPPLSSPFLPFPPLSSPSLSSSFLLPVACCCGWIRHVLGIF